MNVLSQFRLQLLTLLLFLVVTGCTGADTTSSGGGVPGTLSSGNNSYTPSDESSPNVTIGWQELSDEKQDARESAENDVKEGAGDTVPTDSGSPEVDGVDGIEADVVDGESGEDVISDASMTADISDDSDSIDDKDSVEEEAPDGADESDGEQDGEADSEESREKGNCCEAHPTPGCIDEECEADVCAADPFCCEVSWDAKCLDMANQTCAICMPGNVTNPCCAPHQQTGCLEDNCEALICDMDPYCCEEQWDVVCSNAALEYCVLCGGEEPVEPLPGQCCESTDSSGCVNGSCEDFVCGVDPFCCQSAWDVFCASCASGGESYVGDSCAGVEDNCGCEGKEWAHEDLAAYWAPIWYHDVDDSNIEGDYFTAIDADGDLISSNNWESLDDGVTDLKGVIYWSVVETETHYFILYTNFHPQDWDEVCSVGPFYKVCHENDMEGAMVVVRKVKYSPGIFRVLYTEAHNHLYIYRNDENITKKSGEVRNVGVTFEDGAHPQVYVESGGHGVCALYHSEDVSLSADYCQHDMGAKMLECIDAGGGSDCDPADYFPGGDGIVYRPKDVGEIPDGKMDKDAGYELRPFIEEIWPYRDDICDESCLFDGTFEYEGKEFAKSFDGDTWEDDKANPPWAWDSPDDGDVFRGDFFFKPAESLLIHVQMPEEVSVKYLYNPFLTAIDP